MHFPTILPMNPVQRVLMLGCLTLSACGGSDSGGTSGMAQDPARGTLLNSPQLASSFSAAELLARLGGASSGDYLPQLLQLVGSPVCDIAVYHIEYQTVGGAGESTTASGALMVPSGAHGGCSGARPIVLYAHATATDRGFNIADLTNEQNAEGLFLAAVFASQGYIVVAPNYVGYDTSTLGYQTFLVGAQQSGEMIDALQAARSALPTSAAAATIDSGKLYITGYSQGGYVALATHRAMQAAGQAVAASAPMSGPYALSAFVDAVFEGQVDGGAPIVATMLLTAYQRSYGNIYATPTDVFSAPYATGIADLLPTTLTRNDLYTEGKLPQYALFSPTPPSAEYADITPATAPADLAPVFALGFGTGNLITNAYRASYLSDAIANPDGGFPTLTHDTPPASARIALRAALARNDLRDWTPTAPVLLCGGDMDPQVFWFDAALEQHYWLSQDATAAVSVLDLDSPTSAGDPYSAQKSAFKLVKDAVAALAVLNGASDGGFDAVETAYHASLVPPFCLAAVKPFFDAH
jgi:alpha/beta superfamily hydrolase